MTYESPDNINSDFLIRALNDFCRYLEKPTVLVLDNAPTHRSEKFLAAGDKWVEKDLYLFFLPRYSPHLNLAETFWRKAKLAQSQTGAKPNWRKAKYEWLRPNDYASFAKFKKKIKHIFTNIGVDYKIQFQQMIA